MNQLKSAFSKRIGIIATGNEVLQGDISDGNSEFFAKSITELGGDLYQCIKTTDTTSEVIAALDYLFQHVDVVITTGGLGPTSDDVTRFAVAKYFNQPLKMSERAWSHIEKRLHRFQLKINDSNKQQALFPENAILIENQKGSAWGALISSNHNQKIVVMLPGPPCECHPMFEQSVLPWLNSHDFLGKKTIFRWMTLGLIESQIAPEIDKIAQPFDCETGYRWHYPYLEIKVTVPKTEIQVEQLKENITDKLKPYLISCDSLSAEIHLEKNIDRFNQLSHPLYIFDEISQNKLSSQWEIPNAIWVNQDSDLQLGTVENYLHVFSEHDASLDVSSGQIEIKSEIKIGSKQISHHFCVPNRPEISIFARAYLAWRLCVAANGIK